MGAGASVSTEDIRKKGNQEFQDGQYENAIATWTRAIVICDDDPRLFSNRSQGFLKLGAAVEALADAEVAVEAEPGWAKAHYRMGTALMAVGEPRAAASSLRRAASLEPLDKKIRAALDTASRAILRSGGAQRASVYTWGTSAAASPLLGRFIDQRVAPAHTAGAVVSLPPCIDVGCGADFSVVLTAGGEVFSWGLNAQGQCGFPDSKFVPTPRLLAFSVRATVASIGCGAAHVIAITAGGQSFAWGSNSEGQLGIGLSEDGGALLGGPCQIAALADSRAMSVCCGGAHTVLLAQDGLFVFGRNDEGQLGLGEEGDRSSVFVPTRLAHEALRAATHISASATHTAIVSSGSVFTMGLGDRGQLGRAASSTRCIRIVDGLPPCGIAAVSCGNGFTIGLAVDRSCWAWGKNSEGQLGNGTKVDSEAPTRVLGLEDCEVDLVGCEADLVTAMTRGGDVLAWGQARNDGHVSTRPYRWELDLADDVRVERFECGVGFAVALALAVAPPCVLAATVGEVDLLVAAAGAAAADGGVGVLCCSAGDQVSLTIRAVDSRRAMISSGGRRFFATITSDCGETRGFRRAFVDSGDGTTQQYSCTLILKISGEYTLAVRSGDDGGAVHVAGSPFRFSVSSLNIADASQSSIVSLPGVVQCESDIDVAINVCDRYGNTIAQTMDESARCACRVVRETEAADGVVDRCDARVVDRGAARFRFQLPVAGQWKVAVSVLGIPLAGSPYTVEALAAPAHAASCTLMGPEDGCRVDRLEVGVPYALRLLLCDCFGNRTPLGENDVSVMLLDSDGAECTDESGPTAVLVGETKGASHVALLRVQSDVTLRAFTLRVCVNGNLVQTWRWNERDAPSLDPVKFSFEPGAAFALKCTLRERASASAPPDSLTTVICGTAVTRLFVKLFDAFGHARVCGNEANVIDVQVLEAGGSAHNVLVSIVEAAAGAYVVKLTASAAGVYFVRIEVAGRPLPATPLRWSVVPDPTAASRDAKEAEDAEKAELLRFEEQLKRELEEKRSARNAEREAREATAKREAAALRAADAAFAQERESRRFAARDALNAERAVTERNVAAAREKAMLARLRREETTRQRSRAVLQKARARKVLAEEAAEKLRSSRRTGGGWTARFE